MGAAFLVCVAWSAPGGGDVLTAQPTATTTLPNAAPERRWS